MSTVVRAQVRMPATSLKTEDDATNTWHFRVNTTPVPSTTLTALQAALAGFYNTVSSYFVGDYSTTCPVKYFDLADPEPRTPLTTLNITGLIWGSATNVIPREVACCLSFRGVPTSGVDARSLRGRIYLPTPTQSYMDGAGKIMTILRSTVTGAANTLLTASTAAADWDWVIYSPTHNVDHVVVAGFVDDAPDIQRRRGRDPSARNVFP